MGQGGETITVQCACGKRLKAPLSAVGKKAKCPSCGSAVKIEAPPPAELEEVYDFAEPELPKAAQGESPACPKCHSPVAVGTVICVNCGYNFKTGGKLFTRSENNAPAPPGLSRNDRFPGRGSEEVATLPPPWWSWIFVVACLAIPIVTLGGAIPGGLGGGTAATCFALAKNPKLGLPARILCCFLISMGAWLILIGVFHAFARH